MDKQKIRVEKYKAQTHKQKTPPITVATQMTINVIRKSSSINYDFNDEDEEDEEDEVEDDDDDDGEQSTS